MRSATSRSFILSLIFLLLGLCSCHYTSPDPGDTWQFDQKDTRVDSARFRGTYHYWKGYNFVATDSFTLRQEGLFDLGSLRSQLADTLVKPGEVLVVEDIRLDTASAATTLWIKITAVDYSLSRTGQSIRHSSGWVKESIFHQCIVPDTPVAKIIHFLGSRTFKWLLGITGVLSLGIWAGLLYRARRKPNFAHLISLPRGGYVRFFLLTLSGSVTLHRAIWHYVPNEWVEFYHHPALWPLSPDLSPAVGCFMAAVWLLILATLAVMEDVFNAGETMSESVLAVGKVMLLGIIVFAIFAVLIPYALLLPMLLLTWAELLFAEKFNQTFCRMRRNV